MAKALLIKGANFSTNKVTTITFGNIECTGISFAQDEITITGSETVEVEYTVTPANTTDEVVWSSSDNSVVSVSAGVLTAEGIGTATITATCGNFSASATVTVNIAWIPTYANTNAAIITSVTPSILKCESVASRVTACADDSQGTTYVTATTPNKCIKIPNNTSKIRIVITNSSAFVSGTDHAILWAKDEFCGNETFPTAIKPMSQETFNIRSASSFEFNVPDDGTDAFLVRCRFISAPADLYTAMTEAGFNIEFLTV